MNFHANLHKIDKKEERKESVEIRCGEFQIILKLGWGFFTFCGDLPCGTELADCPEQYEYNDIEGNYGRSYGGTCQHTGYSSEDGAEEGDADRAYYNAEEGLEYSHGGKRGEYDQRGDEERSNHLHGDNDNHAGGDRKQGIIKLCFGTGSGGEAFVEGYCEYLGIEEYEEEYYRRGENYAGYNVGLGESQNRSGAEKGGAGVAADIGACAGENVHYKVSKRKRAGGDHCNCGVALDLGIVIDAEKQNCGDDGYRYGYRHRCEVECGGYCGSAEGYVGKTVSDH